MMQVAQNVANRVNEMAKFKELSIGSGTTIILKGNNEGCFSGASNYTGAPLKWDRSGNFYATKVSITGAINATSGSITGDLSVTGKLIFKSGVTERGRIYADTGGVYLTIGGKGIQVDIYGNVLVPDASLTVYNDIVSSHGTITCLGEITSSGGGIHCMNDIYSTGGSIHTDGHDIYASDASIWCYKDMYSTHGSVWAYNDIYTNNGNIHAYGTGGGGSIYAKGNFGTVDGNFYTTNGWISAGAYFNCDGSDGDSGTFTDGSGNTITVKGGIITGGL